MNKDMREIVEHYAQKLERRFNTESGIGSDILQKVYANILSSGRQFSTDEEWTAYVKKAVFNGFINYVHSARYKKNIPLTQANIEDLQSINNDSEEHAAERLIVKIEHVSRKIRKLLDDLKPEMNSNTKINFYAFILFDLRFVLGNRIIQTLKNTPDNVRNPSEYIEKMIFWREDEMQLRFRQHIPSIGAVWKNLAPAFDRMDKKMLPGDIIDTIYALDSGCPVRLTATLLYQWRKRALTHAMRIVGRDRFHNVLSPWYISAGEKEDSP